MSEQDQDARLTHVEAVCDELAATVVMLMHDAHPVYGSTAGWRGGIGGQAITPACSIIDPPPGEDWTQEDLPTQPARDWLREREESGHPVDLEGLRAALRDRWLNMLKSETSR